METYFDVHTKHINATVYTSCPSVCVWIQPINCPMAKYDVVILSGVQGELFKQVCLYNYI